MSKARNEGRELLYTQKMNINTFTLLYKSKCWNAKYTAMEVERKRYSKKDRKERKGIKRKKLNVNLERKDVTGKETKKDGDELKTS